MVKSSNTEEAIKALYVISALIRNNEHGQELFFEANGNLMLQVNNKLSGIIWTANFFNGYQVMISFAGNNEQL